MAPSRTVIVGGGRVGQRTARVLDDRGHDVVVIERDPDRAEAISDEYIATVIQGDATKPSILTQVDLDRTDVAAALTARTDTNLAVCLAIQRLASGVETVMRVEDERREVYEEWVDEVVFPEAAGARVAANAIEAEVRAVEDLGGSLEVLTIRVAEGAPVAGKSLDAVRLPRGSLVISDAEMDRIAGPETTLESGETYLVAVEPDVSDEVLNLFRGGGNAD
ncbi:MAG: TrkA family potassium uptake protein [Haloquadratum sp.]